jgi:hypothetical protein
MQLLIRSFYVGPPGFVHAATLVALLGITTLFEYTSFVYDFATLFFFTCGLGLLARRRWVPFLVLYAFAVFNKETTILLTVVFVLHYRTSLERDLFLKLLVPQVAIFAVSRVVLGTLFGHNEGQYFKPALFFHNVDLLHRYSIANMVAVLAVVSLVVAHWKEKPAFLKTALWTVPPLVGMCLLYGFLDELRAYYEPYPVVIALAAPSVARLMGCEVTRVAPEPALA